MTHEATRGVDDRRNSCDGDTWTTLVQAYPELEGIGTQMDEGRWTLGADGSHWIVRRAPDETSWVATRVNADGVTDMPLTARCREEHLTKIAGELLTSRPLGMRYFSIRRFLTAPGLTHRFEEPS